MELNKSEIDIEKTVNFKQISLNIRRGTYKCIGIGSGRIVFDLGNGYVVKAARNQRGIGQNKAEYKIFLTDNSGLFANISIVSEGFGFLVMEKANRIKDISYVWNYFNVKNNQELYQMQKLQDICSRHGLLKWDFGRAVNWGQINGKPIIIDYGFTKEVRRRFYMPLLFRILGR
jgi:hypothetical protein